MRNLQTDNVMEKVVKIKTINVTSWRVVLGGRGRNMLRGMAKHEGNNPALNAILFRVF